MPSSGTTSNETSQLLAEWSKAHKEELPRSEIAHHPDIDRFFDVLADWNDYLENHVHLKSGEDQEPKP